MFPFGTTASEPVQHVEAAQQVETPITQVQKPKIDTTLCSCVLFLRERLGVDIHGDAGTIIPNIPLAEASVGDVILLDYDGTGHAALITKVTGKGFIVHEANYKHCQEGNREVDVTRESIRGFYRP